VQSVSGLGSVHPRRSPDELAKAWLLAIIERTPLEEIREVDLDLLTTEGGPLIAAVLDAMGSEAEAGTDLSEEALQHARRFARLRGGDAASADVQRDLATLHSLLIESLEGDVPHRRFGGLATSARRLAEVFGAIHAAAAEGHPSERGPAARANGASTLPGDTELHRWLHVLGAEYRRYGHPFALALVDVEGLGPINEVYGAQSGDWMLTAIATVIRNQIRVVDHAFRLGEDGFCVLAPNVGAGRLRPMADRLARVVEASQAADGPRITICVGVSGCPEHGQEGGHLLEVAEEALYAAKAAGQPVEIAAFNGSRPPPDP
jgi:diguanylate cyclase (GGDEF)-like protein